MNETIINGAILDEDINSNITPESVVVGLEPNESVTGVIAEETVTVSLEAEEITALMENGGNGGGGGGGTSDYNQLRNKPSINNIILSNNKTIEELGLAPTKHYHSDEDIAMSDFGGNLRQAFAFAGEALTEMQGGINYLSEEMFNIASELTNKSDISHNHDGRYLTEHQSLAGYAKTTDIPTSGYMVQITYGATTASQIQAILDAGNTPYIIYSGNTYYYQDISYDNFYRFVSITPASSNLNDPPIIKRIYKSKYADTGGWGNGTITLYSTMHKPSASDVGALPNTTVIPTVNNSQIYMSINHDASNIRFNLNDSEDHDFNIPDTAFDLIDNAQEQPQYAAYRVLLSIGNTRIPAVMWMVNILGLPVDIPIVFTSWGIAMIGESEFDAVLQSDYRLRIPQDYMYQGQAEFDTTFTMTIDMRKFDSEDESVFSVTSVDNIEEAGKVVVNGEKKELATHTVTITNNGVTTSLTVLGV